MYKKNLLANNEFVPDEIDTIGIIVSYDIGWNQHATSRIYDSLSGHGYMIGCFTGCMISFDLKSNCSKCAIANKYGNDPKSHYCTVNHTRSSGSMEVSLALDLTADLFNKTNGRIYLEKIVSDDDSTMRSLLKHNTLHDKGKLLLNIPQPLFLADPSHCIKVISKPIFKIVTK